MMKRFALAVVAALMFAAPALAQTPAQTTPAPVSITAGLTYQQLLPSISGNTPRRSLTIQNNNASDSCYLTVGGTNVVGNTTSSTIYTITAAKASILLLPGGSYTRYFPYVPSDQILGTCAATGDSLYLDTQ